LPVRRRVMIPAQPHTESHAEAPVALPMPSQGILKKTSWGRDSTRRGGDGPVRLLTYNRPPARNLFGVEKARGVLCLAMNRSDHFLQFRTHPVCKCMFVALTIDGAAGLRLSIGHATDRQAQAPSRR
jgi:hypothetical protein